MEGRGSYGVGFEKGWSMDLHTKHSPAMVMRFFFHNTGTSEMYILLSTPPTFPKIINRHASSQTHLIRSLYGYMPKLR